MNDDIPVIIGGGLAGLMAALHLAPQPVIVLSRAPLGEQAASAWAQGGLAAAIGADDSPELHLADTLAAGDGLCDAATARRIIEAAPALIEELTHLGARFDAGLGWKPATAAAASFTPWATPAAAKSCAPSSKPCAAPRMCGSWRHAAPHVC